MEEAGRDQERVDRGGSGEAGLMRGLARALALGAEESIEEFCRAGLRDRDYENLSTGRRMQLHAALTGEGKRIICDCADVEPGVGVERYLLASEAGAVVEGALIAALATATSRVVVHVGQDDEAGAEAIRLAAAKNARPVVGASSCLDVRVEVVHAPFRRNMKGYEEAPTLLITGETLLHVSRVLRDGAEEYRMLGTPASPGTKLFQVSGGVNRPGIYQLPLGVTLGQVINETCGGVRTGESLSTVIVGGSKGACFTGDELDLPLEFDSVRRCGAVLGSGAIAVLTESDCVIDRVKQCLAFSCYDTCATCSLGREGSYQLREIVTDATRGKSKRGDLDMLREVGVAMQLGAACAFGRTAPNLVLSAMEKFPEEFEAHMKRKLCRALVCTRYVTFHILPDKCDGCGECVNACPEDAIEGGRQKIHVVDQDACEKCGKCWEVCNGLRQAVVKAGAIKPRTPKRPVPVGSWNG